MFFRKPKLIVPESYKKASRVQLKKICNGCGPKGYDWFVPDDLLGVDITQCCNIHDWMYEIGTKPTDRLWADITFYINMQRCIKFSSKEWKTLRKVRLNLALFYFRMVRKHGEEAFISSDSPKASPQVISNS